MRRAVPNGDVLVGVPCYKDGSMVDACLRTLAEPGVQLLIVDNGSAPDVKRAISGKGDVIRNEVNRYVNPAWNQVMEVFLRHADRYDLLVLANSDLILDPGWADRLRAHRRSHRGDQLIFGVDAPRQRRSAGTFFAMTRDVVAATYPIPDDLLIMGGDDFIFHVVAGVGYEEHVVSSITMTHVERGTYDKSPEIWSVARKDTACWNRRGVKDLVVPRVKKILSLESIHDHVRDLHAAHLDDCVTCARDAVCAACTSGNDGGHACNCHQEGGGRGYRLQRILEVTTTKESRGRHVARGPERSGRHRRRA